MCTRDRSMASARNKYIRISTWLGDEQQVADWGLSESVEARNVAELERMWESASNADRRAIHERRRSMRLFREEAESFGVTIAWASATLFESLFRGTLGRLGLSASTHEAHSHQVRWWHGDHGRRC